MTNLYCIRPKGFNIGNDVIYLALNHFLRNAFNGPINVISLPATSKYESQKKAGLNPQTIYEINQFGHGVVIGGGNLYENGEIEINPTALKALEVPLMVFSLSRGKIYNKNLKLVDRTDVITDDKIKVLNQKADFFFFFFIATYEHIKSLGVENTLGGCPTLFINEIPQHLVPYSDEISTDVLISVRTPSLMSIPVSMQYSVRGTILQAIESLKARGYSKIKILCHDHRDIPFAATFDGIDYLYTEDVYSYLTYLKNTKLNLTFRLHSFIPGLALNIPVINISYDQRAMSMLETIGMEDWNINLVSDDVIAELNKRVDSLGDLDALKEKLKESHWKDLKSTIETNFAKFASMVEERKS